MNAAGISTADPDANKNAALFSGYTNGGAALLQFFSNPWMGMMSDSFGRKPFACIASLGLTAVMVRRAALVVPDSLPSLLTRLPIFSDRRHDWTEPHRFHHRDGDSVKTPGHFDPSAAASVLAPDVVLSLLLVQRADRRRVHDVGCRGWRRRA
jgi:hypothetical protein